MKEVTRIAWIAKDLESQLEWAQCLWARAILHIGLAHFDDEAKPPTSNHAGNFHDLAAHDHSLLYPDGSGCSRHVPRVAKKAGAAVAAVRFKDKDYIDSPTTLLNAAIKVLGVPGEQAVPRAEIVAATECKRAAPNKPYRTDSEYVVKGATYDGPNLLLKNMSGRNGDTWEAYCQARQPPHKAAPYQNKPLAKSKPTTN